MRHLNYNHLLYFWTVAREGSIARASEALFLTPQTISGQLKLLEEAIGKPLFHRVGRRLVLSETGQIVNQYADEIFSLGAELTQRMKSGDPGAPFVLNVGIVNSIAKLIAYQILEPALELEEDMRMVCWEGSLEQLLADLAVHRLDLVISDHPIPTGLSVKAYNHRLGESGVSFFADPRKAKAYSRDFPRSLDDAPLLLPVNTSALRRRLDDWFEERSIRPTIIAEFDDSALLKAFGEAGIGLFPAPTAIAGKVESMYSSRQVGEIDGVIETYYAISPERKIKHPAILSITETARERVFS
ncbi:MAG: transcriptional activator NhaR [Pseudomonadales bacterium]